MIYLLIILLLLILGKSVVLWLVFMKVKQSGATDSGLNSLLTNNRLEINQTLKNTTDSLNQQLTNMQTVLQKQQADLRADNNRQLEQIRQVVDEKLQATLEKRLTESFKRVDQQLEAVYKSMGEMQNLAVGVGELQRTLSGVKTKGIWGEAHLGNLLSEVLSASQYETDFQPDPRRKIKVEFALKIPGDDQTILYMPIDAKLPLNNFSKLQKALEDNESKKIEQARKALLADIKKQAKEIGKYINPPRTTNFAVMYLPLESLYAEISQHSQLIEELRLKFKITVVGPNTILPMLGILNMGYRSLAIQQKVGQVWDILLETQQEFMNFNQLLSKAKFKLEEVGKVIDDASSKTQTIEKKFKKVQKIEMPAGKTLTIEEKENKN